MEARDQRAHPRVPLVLSAELQIPGDPPRQCVVTDLSPGGAGLQYLEGPPRPDVIAALAIEEFGTFDGITVRDQGDCRGLRFLQGEAERNHLMAKLILYIEEGLADNSARTSRPASSRLSLALLNGDMEACDVQRISLRGVSLLTDKRPLKGELVRLGRMYGRVAEHHADGVDIRFLSFVNAAAPSPEASAKSPLHEG